MAFVRIRVVQIEDTDDTGGIQTWVVDNSEVVRADIDNLASLFIGRERDNAWWGWIWTTVQSGVCQADGVTKY